MISFQLTEFGTYFPVTNRQTRLTKPQQHFPSPMFTSRWLLSEFIFILEFQRYLDQDTEGNLLPGNELADSLNKTAATFPFAHDSIPLAPK